jgi:hypothetical protein
MFRALVNRRPAGDFPQRIARLSDSHPHVAMHAEAMDGGPLPDQAALYGLLDRIAALGPELLEVGREQSS